MKNIKWIINKKSIFICMLLFFLTCSFSLLSTALLLKPINKILLIKQYGLKKVNNEHLKIINTKPLIQVSNGDELHTITFLYNIMIIALISGQVILYLFIINHITAGWFLYIFKNINNYKKEV